MARRTREALERTGKTVDEAVQRALRDLGLDRTEVEVQVISEGRAGVLGIGAASARVRVTPLAPGDPGEAAPAAREEALPRIDDYELDEREEVGPHRQPGRGSRGRAGERNAPWDRGRRDRGRGREQPEPQVPLEDRIPFEMLASPMEEPVEDPVEHAENILHDLMRIMGIDAEVTSRPPETPMDGLDHAAAVLDVNPAHAGDDLGFLIGRRGEHLAALQYIVNVILSQTHSGGNPVTVDVHHYKRRREESLNALARQMADEVRRTKQEVDLEPMSAAERRIIHLALAEETGVATESVGTGDARRVTIVYLDEG